MSEEGKGSPTMVGMNRTVTSHSQLVVGSHFEEYRGLKR